MEPDGLLNTINFSDQNPVRKNCMDETVPARIFIRAVPLRACCFCDKVDSAVKTPSTFCFLYTALQYSVNFINAGGETISLAF